MPLRRLPIIMLAAQGERPRVLEAVGLGVHGFLLKPVSHRALQARIVSALTRRSPDAASALRAMAQSPTLAGCEAAPHFAALQAGYAS